MKGDQSKQLPVTTSSYIVDDKGTEGYFLFVVLTAGVVFNIIIQNIPGDIGDNSFPLACAFTILVYILFKRYLNGKPPMFLMHLLIYPTLAKKFTHQFKARETLFSDE